MYIKSFHIDGFGVFHDFGRAELPKRIVVFYGENEAGKSTLLAFFRAMFFGFAKGKEDANKYPPLKGGVPSGTLSLALQDGSQWKLHRTFAGAKRGLEIWDDQGATISEDDLNQAFSGAGKEMYRNVYAFSLRELQELSSLQGDQIRSALYAATVGSGLRSLAQAEKSFNGAINDLYGARAQERLINKKLQELNDLHAKVESLSADAARFSELQEQIRQLDEELRTKQAEHYSIDQRYRTIAQLVKQDSGRQIVEVPDVGDLLAAQEQRLQVLLELVPQARSDYHLVEQVSLQWRDAEARVAERLQELGQNWHISRVNEIVSSHPQPHDVLAFEQQFSRLDSDHLHGEEALQQLSRERAAKQKEVEEIQAQLEGVEQPEDIDMPPALLERLKAGSDKFAADCRQQESAKDEVEKLTQTLTNAAEQIKDVLSTDELSSALQELCDPQMLDASAPTLTIANLVNRGIILLNKDAVSSTETEVKLCREAVLSIQDRIADAEESLSSLKHDLRMVPNVSCVPADVSANVAANKGRILELFDKAQTRRREMTTLERQIEAQKRGLECSLTYEQLARMDYMDIRQAAELNKRETQKLSARIQELSVQTEALKQSIRRAGAKHQLLRTQIKEVEDSGEGAPENPGQLLADLTELRKAIARMHSLFEKCEMTSSRIADKERSRQVLEQTSAQNFARQSKLVASCLVVTGIAAAAYLGAVHHALGPAAGAVIIAVLLAVVMLQSLGSKAPEASKEFAKEIAELQNQLKQQKAQLQQTETQTKELSERLGLDGSPSADDLDEMELTLKTEAERVKKLQEAQQIASEMHKDIAKLGKEQAKRETELSVGRSSLESSQRAWRIHLDSIGVGAQKTPDETMAELSVLIDRSAALVKLVEAEETDRQALAEIKQFLKEAGVSTPPENASQEAWVKAIDNWIKTDASHRDKQNQRKTISEKMGETAKSIESLRKELQECQDKETEALTYQRQARFAWQRWLIAAGLPETLSCDLALSLADTVSHIDEVRGCLRAQRLALRNYEQSTLAYRQLATGIPSIAERAQTMPAAELLGTLSVLSAHMETAIAQKLEYAMVSERLKTASGLLVETRRRMDELEKLREQNLQETNKVRNDWRQWLLKHHLDADLTTSDVTRLLPALSKLQTLIAESDEMKRKLAVVNEQLQSFNDQSRQLFQALNLGDVQMPAACDWVMTLGERLLEQLGAAADRLLQQIDGLGEESSEQAGVRHRISTLIAKRDRLAQSRELLELRQKEESLLTEVEALSTDWCRLVLARHLLDRAKERFEREGQPQVVEIAARLFNHMTDGAYTGVLPSVEVPGEFLVESRSEKRLPAAVLSTGTQEQLYLSLRFGFIKHRDGQTEPLPVVMDDILVNFDDRRANLAVQAIRELSTTHQILYFTCHPTSVAMFKALDPTIELVNLSGGSAEDAIKRLMDKFSASMQEEVVPAVSS